MINAFVLVSAEPSHVPELAEALVSIDAVAEVYSVAGDLADIVAVLRVREHEELADVVTGKIASLTGVKGTTTLIAFRAYSRQDLEALWDFGPR